MRMTPSRKTRYWIYRGDLLNNFSLFFFYFKLLVWLLIKWIFFIQMYQFNTHTVFILKWGQSGYISFYLFTSFSLSLSESFYSLFLFCLFISLFLWPLLPSLSPSFSSLFLLFFPSFYLLFFCIISVFPFILPENPNEMKNSNVD